MADQQQASQSATQRAANLTLISEMALACAAIDAETDLPRLIAEKLHALTQSVAVAITTYDAQKQTLAVQHVSVSGQIFSAFKKIWGHNINGVTRPLDPALKQRMLSEVVFVAPDVTETILGLIPRPIAIGLQKTLGVGGFTGLALIYNGELWGTAAIILRSDQTPLEREVALALSHIIAITMHRQAAEKALRRAEEKYRNIVENAMEGIFQSTPEGRFLSLNPAMARMYGYATPQEMMQSITDISQQIYADSQDRINIEHRLETEGFVQDFEMQDRRKDGSIFWTSMNVRTVHDEQGRTLYYEGTVEDITARKQAEEALRQSQERYANFVEQSLEGIWMLAFDEPIPLNLPIEEQARRLQALGYVAECNDAMARMYGYASSRELHGVRLEQLYGNWGEINFEATLKLAQSGYRAGNRETREVTKTGDTIYLLNSAVGIIQNEQLMALWGTQQDITALKQAEQAIRASEQKFRAFIEQSADGLVLANGQGQIVEWNQAQVVLTGVERAEAVGQLLWDVQMRMVVPEKRSPGYREMLQKVILTALSTGQGHFLQTPHEVELCRPDGQRLFIQQVAFPIQTDMGYYLGSVTRDISERKQAEHALRESQAMLQLIFDHAFDGISVYEEFPEQGTRRLLDCNARYAEMAGRSREELLAIGNTLPIQKDVDYPINRQQFLARLDAGVYTGRFAWLRPDGQDNVVEYTAVPRHVDDRFLVIGVDHDITAQVQAAQERETLIKELEAKNAELERFTYTVSHDLKAPLITIGGFLGFLEKDAQAGNLERVKADVARISEAATKMQRLLNELLELSRIGRLMHPPQTVSFEMIAREAVELTHGRIRERGVQVEISPNLPVVHGDRARLVEVMQNLVDNACKFMGNQPQPHLEIGVAEAEGQPVFFVRDNGIGIDPPYHERIFGLFDKLDPQTEGTGIGLTLVERIIEVHGGKIWVESEGLGKGTTFYFTLGPVLKTAHG
jgi:PAS domain S-box-containing protein